MTLKVLIVDDEPLARARLCSLLGDCTAPAVTTVAEAAQAVQAMQLLQRESFDAVLLDIHMPGADGLKLAATLRELGAQPAVIFVTAHAEHAVKAFELEALDYLTKPVSLARLQAALTKVQRQRTGATAVASLAAAAPVATPAFLLIQDRGRAERVPLAEVLYFKAELKYVTVRTALRSYILDGSLSELEERFPGQFVRIHRNTLVARQAMRSIERHTDPAEPDGGESWAVRLHGVDELLPISRRQLSAAREAIAAPQ